jgi:hypothetical protein
MVNFTIWPLDSRASFGTHSRILEKSQLQPQQEQFSISAENQTSVIQPTATNFTELYCTYAFLLAASNYTKFFQFSRGYDGITTEMLKVNAPYISSPLHYICYKFMWSGTFPFV